MPRTRLLIWLVAHLISIPAFAADAKVPVKRTTNDRLTLDTLTAIHDRGAALFNAGDHSGSYRLFQGALMTTRMVLPRELHEIVDRGLADAEREPGAIRRAMLLHEVIEAVRVKLHATAGPAPTQLHPPRKVTGDGEPPKAPELATKPMEPDPAKLPLKIEFDAPAPPKVPAQIEIPIPMPPTKPANAIKPTGSSPPPVTVPMEDPLTAPGPIIIPTPAKK